MPRRTNSLGRIWPDSPSKLPMFPLQKEMNNFLILQKLDSDEFAIGPILVLQFGFRGLDLCGLVLGPHLEHPSLGLWDPRETNISVWVSVYKMGETD